MPVLQNSNFKPIKSSYCSLKADLKTGRALFILAQMKLQRRQRKRCLQHVPCPGVAGTGSDSRQGFSSSRGFSERACLLAGRKTRASAAAHGWHPAQQTAPCGRAGPCWALLGPAPPAAPARRLSMNKGDAGTALKCLCTWVAL